MNVEITEFEKSYSFELEPDNTVMWTECSKERIIYLNH